MENLDFGAKYIKEITILGQKIWITETMVNTTIACAVLILFAVIVRIKLNKFKYVPESKFQNIVEILVSSMDDFVTETMGKKYSYFGNWFFGIFAFVLVANLMGLLGFRAPTADLATTLGLTITTFVLTHFMGIYVNKGGYFKGYLEPMPLLLPLNIIGELATPLSLSLRLFGNILGGTIIMGLLYAVTLAAHFIVKIFVVGAAAPVLHIYFDLFAGFLQTFIFVVLSMSFIRDKIGD